MKHNIKITVLLLLMFFVAQLIGIYVAKSYLPETISVINQTTGEIENKTSYNIPYGFNPPEDIEPRTTVISIIIALAIAVTVMLLLMKIRAETFLRMWFLIVVVIGISLAINAFIKNLPYAPLIALAVAIPIAIMKIFGRNIIAHNASELLIYPGIATVFIPLLNIWTVVLLLLLISVYDIYAVWHSGFMQKMAQYQIRKLRIFSGFFVPYMGSKEAAMLKDAEAKGKKLKKIKVQVAILGGGDVIFPIILAGVVLGALGIIQAIIISVGATIALAVLFYYSEKGKYYPAMPFITAGCLIALGVAYFV